MGGLDENISKQNQHKTKEFIPQLIGVNMG